MTKLPFPRFTQKGKFSQRGVSVIEYCLLLASILLIGSGAITSLHRVIATELVVAAVELKVVGAVGGGSETSQTMIAKILCGVGLGPCEPEDRDDAPPL